MQDESHYLQYLPAIYHSNDFLADFLRIFEELMRPVEDILKYKSVQALLSGRQHGRKRLL